MLLHDGTPLASRALVVPVSARPARSLAWRAAPLLAAIAGLATLGCTPAPRAAAPSTARGLSTFDQGGVMSADALRTGWYADEPLLDPTLVGSSAFGQVWDALVDGQVYAQPLYVGGAVLVATETNHVYALDATTGAALWIRPLEIPWNPADLDCGDLSPSVGVTSTPAVDPTTNTVYVLAKTYANGASGAAAWLAHALDLATGAERPGFPVAISGVASNEPAATFDATHEHQRPGLLLMDGVVYAAFGGHCDRPPYTGWVVGISTKGFVSTLWTTEAGPSRTVGGGVWMAGGALVSDRDGELLFVTSNDAVASTTPVAGRTPPGALGESVVRLQAQADGSLRAVDFFAPAELPALNATDADLGAGAPVALPAVFGTVSHPNVLAQAGKAGFLYLLDRDDLGGYLQGAGGADHVLQRLGPGGGVWSKPAVWPGDGGYLYLPVVNGCDGPTDLAGCLRAYQRGVTADDTPALALAATSTSSFGYGSSAVVVTSDGTRSGSALAWTIWSSGPVSATSQLRAYDAVPEGATLKLRFLAGVGSGGRFTAPGVGGGRVFVGTGDGHVLGFGVTGGPPLRASGTAFAPALVGETQVSSVELSASGAVTIVAVATSGDFTLTADSPTVPFSLASGDVRAIPIAFRPSLEGPVEGALVVTTSQGPLALTLTGAGESAVPHLVAAPSVLAFAPIVKGGVATQTLSLTNVGAAPLTISAAVAPTGPFTVDALPAPGTPVAPGGSLDVTVRFAPTTMGSAASSLGVTAGGAVTAVAIEGAALAGGQLRMAPTALDLGAVSVGASVRAVFQLTNIGDAPVVIEKSKPPTSPAFQPQTALPEGTVIAPGASSEQVIRVSPDVLGYESDAWVINSDDGSGLRELALSVTGVPAPPPAPDAGASSVDGGVTEMSAPAPTELAQSREEPPEAIGHACAIGAEDRGPGPAALLVALGAVLLARRRVRRRS